MKRSPYKVILGGIRAKHSASFAESLHLQFLFTLQRLAFMTRHQFFPACPPFVNTVYTYSTFWSTWIHGYIETPNDVTSDNISRFDNAFKSTIYYPKTFLNVFSKNEKLTVTIKLLALHGLKQTPSRKPLVSNKCRF